jgi:flagellar motor protein MotB
MKSRRNKTEPNYWAAYADCMLALFMIALLLWILSSGKTIFAKAVEDPGPPVVTLPVVDHEKLLEENESLKSEQEKLKKLIAALEDKIATLEKENQELEKENQELENENQELEEKNQDLNRKPPIIELAEGNKKFRFSPGSASLSEDFRDELRFQTFPKLRKTLGEFPRVDTIEIIGHTDGDLMQGASNLDARVPDVILNNDPVAQLKAGSNADLGLMRALAIRQEWQEWARKNGFAKDIDVRCYSAAQTIPANGAAGFNKLRNKAEHAPSRRIEIRVTDLKQ